MSLTPGSAVARLQRVARLRPPALPAPPPHLGRWLVGALALTVVLLAGYMLWFRDSSLVSVEQVKVSGATSADAARVRTTLSLTGRSMTTLHVDRKQLEQAVAGFPVVRGLEIHADFPHTLRIRVLERVPAAIALIGTARVPVASDGTVLRGVDAKGSLPTLEARGGLDGDRLSDPRALRAAEVAGAAPVVLRRRLEDVSYDGERGLVAHLRDGPELVFGTAARIRAKWIAAARVLADPEAQGGSYIDVRLPGRPAVGGLSAAAVTPTAPPVQAPPTVVAQAPTAPATQAPTTPTTPAPTAPTAAATGPPDPVASVPATHVTTP